MSARAWSVIAAVMVLAGCDAPAPEAETRQLVRTVAVEQGRMERRLAFSGTLQPVQRARLAFQSSGVLVQRPVELGQFVREGELLATLDNPELGPAQRGASAALQEVLARRDQARRDTERLDSLLATGAVGEERAEQQRAELDALESAVARAEAELAGTRQRLRDATLVAPFDGMISALDAEPGEFVAAGQAVMAIGEVSRLEVGVGVPAVLLGTLEPGASVDVRVPQLPEQGVRGRVTEVSAIGEPHSGLFPVVVELELDAAQSPLRAGMLAEVLVVDTDLEGLLLPLSAVVDPVGGNPVVYRVGDGRVHPVPVDVLASADQRVAVRPRGARLQAGDHVVVEGHRSLTDGQPVREAQ